MNRDLISLSDFIDQEIAVKGTKKRKKYDEGFEAFKAKVVIQQSATKQFVVEKPI